MSNPYSSARDSNAASGNAFDQDGNDKAFASGALAADQHPTEGNDRQPQLRPGGSLIPPRNRAAGSQTDCHYHAALAALPPDRGSFLWWLARSRPWVARVVIHSMHKPNFHNRRSGHLPPALSYSK